MFALLPVEAVEVEVEAEAVVEVEVEVAEVAVSLVLSSMEASSAGMPALKSPVFMSRPRQVPFACSLPGSKKG